MTRIVIRMGAAGGYQAIDYATGQVMASHSNDAGTLVKTVLLIVPDARISFGAGLFDVITPIPMEALESPGEREGA